jgi:hypothetical protein
MGEVMVRLVLAISPDTGVGNYTLVFHVRSSEPDAFGRVFESRMPVTVRVARNLTLYDSMATPPEKAARVDSSGYYSVTGGTVAFTVFVTILLSLFLGRRRKREETIEGGVILVDELDDGEVPHGTTVKNARVRETVILASGTGGSVPHGAMADIVHVPRPVLVRKYTGRDLGVVISEVHRGEDRFEMLRKNVPAEEDGLDRHIDIESRVRFSDGTEVWYTKNGERRLL